MEQLLPFEFIRDVELVEVVVYKINAKLIEQLFDDLKTCEEIFFKESLSHLKRVNKDFSHLQEKLEKDESFALICLKEV